MLRSSIPPAGGVAARSQGTITTFDAEGTGSGQGTVPNSNNFGGRATCITASCGARKPGTVLAGLFQLSSLRATVVVTNRTEVRYRIYSKRKAQKRRSVSGGFSFASRGRWER